MEGGSAIDLSRFWAARLALEDYDIGEQRGLDGIGGLWPPGLVWDVSSGEVWVEPALIGYPAIP
jgi:hypothetical protein